jgi:PAS domain S-box-containing protein
MRKPKILNKVHWLVLLIGVSITLLMWDSARRDSGKKLQHDFEERVNQINNRIEKRVQDGRIILRATAGLFNVTNTVTREEYQTYIRSHNIGKNYRGIKSVAVSMLVQAKEKKQLSRLAKKEGVSAYRVWPEGNRAIYAPVWYIEPYATESVKHILGFDLLTEKALRMAMESARDKGAAQTTSLVDIMTDDSRNPKKGFLVFAPIYRDSAPRKTVEQRRKNIIGWVHLSFMTDEVIEGIMTDGGGDMRDDFIFHIYLGDPAAENSLIYQSDPDDLAISAQVPKYNATKVIEIPGSSFSVIVQSKPEFETRLNDTKSIAILTAGTATSVLIALLVWLLASGRERAIQLAKKMNQNVIESEKRYREMFEENASMAYILDPITGNIIDANQEAAKFWGYSQKELRSMSIGDINIAPLVEIQKGMKQQMGGGIISQVYFRHRLKNGDVRDVEIYRTTLSHKGNSYIYCISHDITSRRKTERALYESQAKLHAIIETAMDAVVQLNEHGIIIDWNTRAEKIFGLKRKEAIGKSLVETVIPEAQHAAYKENAMKFVDGEEGAVRHSHFEIEAKFRDGQEFPIEVSITTLTDGEGRSEYCVFMHDITDRKKSENALRRARIELENRVFERTAELVRANRRLNAEIAERTQAQGALQQSQEMLRQLVAHQDRIRETERKRIAREIHDELGQHLLVLRIDVTMLGRTESEHPKISEKVELILQHIDETMRSVRAIINNLRPSVLDLGLYAALEWQAEEFQRRSGIICELIAGDEDMELDDSIATVLFRILQEALTNVLRHAKATYVKIELFLEPGCLVMTISDNGIGMQQAKKSEQSSFGLVGIRERLYILGGELYIDSSNEGTVLTVSVPIPS